MNSLEVVGEFRMHTQPVGLVQNARPKKVYLYCRGN